MPTSSGSVSAFLIKYSRRGSEEIARRLLNPSLTTTEHVHPRSKNGQNNTANYIAMCAECNSQRGNMPYLEWFKIRPEMPENLQKYINKIAERIKSKELRGFDSYIFEIIRTIERETDGQLILEKPDLDTIEVSDASIELGKIRNKKPKKSYFERLEKTIKDKKENLEELKKIASRFKKDEEFINLQKYNALVEEIDSLVEKKRQISDELNEAKREQRTNDARIKAIQNAEEQLKKPGLKPKEANELRSKLRNAKAKVQPAELPALKVNTLDEEYKKITSEIERKRTQLAEILTNLTLEEDYKVQEEEILAKIEERDKIKQKIYSLEKQIDDKKQVVSKKNQIEKSILAKKEVLMQIFGKEYVIDANTSLVKKYDLLVKKLNIVDNMDPKTFCSELKAPRGIKYSFILQEARASILSQIEELKKHDIVKYRESQLEVEKLEKERKECNIRLKEINDIEKAIEKLKLNLASLNSIQSERELSEKLDLIKTKHYNLKEKIKYLNIDERIKDAIETIKELEAEYARKP